MQPFLYLPLGYVCTRVGTQPSFWRMHMRTMLPRYLVHLSLQSFPGQGFDACQRTPGIPVVPDSSSPPYAATLSRAKIKNHFYHRGYMYVSIVHPADTCLQPYAWTIARVYACRDLPTCLYATPPPHLQMLTTRAREFCSACSILPAGRPRPKERISTLLSGDTALEGT